MGKHAILLSITQQQPTRAPLAIDEENSSQQFSYSLFYIALGISLTVIIVLVFLSLMALFFLKKEERCKKKVRRGNGSGSASEQQQQQPQQNGSNKNGTTGGIATVSSSFSEMTHL